MSRQHVLMYILYHAGGLDFNLTNVTMSTQVSLNLLGSGESLSINPLQVFQDGRYELDEIIQLQFLPAEGETALETGEPAIVTLVDSDGKSKLTICKGKQWNPSIRTPLT